jgi:hypothetical protein
MTHASKIIEQAQTYVSGVRDPDSDAIWWTVPYMRHGPYRGTRCRFFRAVRWPDYMLRLWHCEAAILLLLLLPRHKGVHMPQVDH